MPISWHPPVDITRIRPGGTEITDPRIQDQHYGFVVLSRSATDGDGRPFPILHMGQAAVGAADTPIGLIRAWLLTRELFEPGTHRLSAVSVRMGVLRGQRHREALLEVVTYCAPQPLGAFAV